MSQFGFTGMFTNFKEKNLLLYTIYIKENKSRWKVKC